MDFNKLYKSHKKRKLLSKSEVGEIHFRHNIKSDGTYIPEIIDTAMGYFMSRFLKVGIASHNTHENRYKFDLHPQELITLEKSIRNNDRIEFVVDEDNKTITGFVIVPKEKENKLSEYLKYLNNRERVFINNNKIWTVKFGDEFNQFPNAVYFNYIYYILKNPFKSISLAEIMSNAQPNKFSYEEIRHLTDGHTIDFEVRKNDINRALNEYKKKHDDLSNKYQDALEDNDEKEMIRIDNDIYFITEEMIRLKTELKYRPKNISVERKKCANIISKQISLFKSLIAESNMGELYLHIDNHIKVDNGCEYKPEDSSLWCTTIL